MELGLAWLAAGIGVGISVLGAGTGIGRLGAAALEAASRQPETAAETRTLMLIAAALIEGIALIACIVCILLAVKSA
ncbi:MAG: ATP synthase F0 subunit C [Chlorobiota bacterium]|jgi:F-type H+-transporting ATPase subunit c|nr:ATP synthase F0 subunit C [Chlorobiota bacterium]